MLVPRPWAVDADGDVVEDLLRREGELVFLPIAVQEMVFGST
jgi:hypothetical protein